MPFPNNFLAYRNSRKEYERVFTEIEVDPRVGEVESLLSKIEMKIEFLENQLIYSIPGYGPMRVPYIGEMEENRYAIRSLVISDHALCFVELHQTQGKPELMKGLLDAHSRYLPRAGLASKNVLVKNKDGLYRGLVISIDGLSVASVFLVDEGAIDRVHIDKLRDFSGHWVTQLPLQVLPICLPALDYYAPQNIKELLDNAFHSGFIYISREPDVSNPDNLVICPRIMLTDYLGQVDLLDMYFTHPDQVMPFDHVPNLRHYVLEEM